MRAPDGSDPDDVIQKASRLIESLKNYDDRALVITMVAFMDESLTQLLRKRLVQSQQTDELFAGSQAPLGSFSSRARMAVAVGCLPSNEYADLEIVRKIRNDAAHLWEGFSLADARQANRIANFSPLDPLFVEDYEAHQFSPRQTFRAKTFSLLFRFTGMAHWMDHRHPTKGLLYTRITSAGEWPIPDLD